MRCARNTGLPNVLLIRRRVKCLGAVETPRIKLTRRRSRWQAKRRLRPLCGRGSGENLSIVLQKCGIARPRHVVPLSQR